MPQSFALGGDNPPSALQGIGVTNRLAFEREDLIYATATQMMHNARLVEAEAMLRDLIARDPKSLRGYMALAAVRERIGDVDGSIELFDKALEIAPNNLGVISGAIFSYDRRPEATLEDSYRWRRRYNDLVKQPARPHLNDRAPDRKLRVGYVSGDFRHHSAALVFGPVMLNHDPAHFDVYAYSSAAQGDWLTDQMMAGIRHWRRIAAWDDDRLDQQIRKDQIDILVDLSGHTGGNRLPVFARKPAPVQVTAWGYITGTGLDAMDYMFADADTVFPDEEQWYAEKIVRLDRIVPYWAADPSLVGPVGPLPCERNGHLTFGVFNRLGKLKRETIGLWADVLKAVPDARLILKAPGLDDENTRLWLTQLFSEAGADLGRLQFRGQSSHTEHMQAYNEIDVALDPWPDGGGVSTLEAMWMGVPTITVPHRQIASRLTTSFNREMGLPFLIASSFHEYVERAAELNTQRAELANVRRLLRDMMVSSAFCDHEYYVRRTEDEYRKMWHAWVAEQANPSHRPTHMTLVAG